MTDKKGVLSSFKASMSLTKKKGDDQAAGVEVAGVAGAVDA